MNRSIVRWGLPMAAGAVICCMLSFFETSNAAPKAPQMPFANSVEQRGEMVRQLREINALLKEQNALLRSGKLKVVVDQQQ